MKTSMYWGSLPLALGDGYVSYLEYLLNSCFSVPVNPLARHLCSARSVLAPCLVALSAF